jgi:hypothetical protein
MNERGRPDGSAACRTEMSETGAVRPRQIRAMMKPHDEQQLDLGAYEIVRLHNSLSISLRVTMSLSSAGAGMANSCKLRPRPRHRWLSVLLFVAIGTVLYAQTDTDFDEYKLRIDGYWFYSNPSPTLQDATTGGVIDLNKDFAFSSYSTITGKFDWKFTRKNHLYLVGAAFNQSRLATLQRTIVFNGQTFNVGLVTKANLSAPLIAPGYQYDIIRSKRGHLGLALQFDVFNSEASLFAAAQANNNNQAISSKKSLLVPIPVAGPQFRYYLTNFPRLYVEGNVFGMYLFGYGNFVSTADDVGVTLNKHLSVNAGYQLGSRLTVNDDAKKNRLGLRLTQQGPIVGLEASF